MIKIDGDIKSEKSVLQVQLDHDDDDDGIAYMCLYTGGKLNYVSVFVWHE